MWHIPSYMNRGEYHLFSNFEIWKFQIDKIKHRDKKSLFLSYMIFTGSCFKVGRPGCVSLVTIKCYIELILLNIYVAYIIQPLHNSEFKM